MTFRARVLLSGVLALASASAASAQMIGHGAPQPPSIKASTLRHHLGVDVAEALLKSQESDERERGFERLGSVGTAQALDSIIKAFDPGGAARSARDRLIAVRALAPHAKVPAVRELLVRVMVGVGTNPERPEAIDGLIEHAAALALAASDDESALSALAKAVRQPGHVAETAADALLAFPPRKLEPLLAVKTAPTKTLVHVLEGLGDPRAIPTLREIVRSAAPEVRAEAAFALARFGDLETIELARHWLTQPESAAVTLTAARILVQLHASDAAAAVTKLFEHDTARSAALELAASTSLPALAPKLLELARKANATERATLYAALALAGTHDAFSFLGGALGTPDTSQTAALTLALAPADDAEAELARALAAASTRRVAVRASFARKIALGRVPAGFSGAVRELARSADPADRAAAAQASAISSPSDAPALLAHADAVTARALARAAFFPEVSDALAARLAVEKDAALREALSASLVSTKAAERVPSDVLLALLDARGFAAPLALRALAMRDSATLRPRIVGALASDDWLMRAHAALGLGHSEDPTALGLLENAYRFETDERVRLALVHALALRPEPARKRALTLAASLDAGKAVRSAAALALGAAVPASPGVGPQSAWLDLRAPNGQPQATAAALVITAEGLAVPALSDPDGVLILPGLPTGEFSLRLAPGPGTNQAPPRAPLKPTP